MFESRHEPVLSRPLFVRRMARSLGVTALVLGGSLGLGALGYRFIARLNWVDALYNASMILTGMGPVDPMVSDAAKLFASAYALFSGVIFLMVITIVLAPVAHRILHKFHVDDRD